MIGPRRFLEKVWKLYQRNKEQDSKDKKFLAQYAASSVENILHKTIKKVSDDIESMSFNTAVSSLMILVNEMEKVVYIKDSDFGLFLKILAPFAPHITEEIWCDMGEKKSIHISKWPTWNKSKMVDEQIKIVIQVNGRVRSQIMVSSDIAEDELQSKAMLDGNVLPWVQGQVVKKIIYVKGRLVNIVL